MKLSNNQVQKLLDGITVECTKIENCWQANSVKLLVNLYGVKKEYSKELLAYIFHHAVAKAIVDMASRICEEWQVNQIALSGGSFINRILLAEVIRGLSTGDKKVYINEKVPCGDGGIALGQMYLATFE